MVKVAAGRPIYLLSDCTQGTYKHKQIIMTIIIITEKKKRKKINIGNCAAMGQIRRSTERISNYF